jgi:hypothetical protein
MTATTTKADPTQARQLSLEGPILLWRDQQKGGRREGLLLTTDVCANPACTDRHIGVEALRVGNDLLAVELDRREIATAYPAGTTSKTQEAFFVSVNPDDGRVEPQGDVPDPEALAWFRSEIDAELLAILLARFEGARRRLIEEEARHTPARRAAAPGRNDPCPCGSGRKYKKCCAGRAS